MFEEFVTNDEVKSNDLEKKIFNFVCNFGCLILKLILESYDRKLTIDVGYKIATREKEEISELKAIF